jgi:hypothetical protein
MNLEPDNQGRHGDEGSIDPVEVDLGRVEPSVVSRRVRHVQGSRCNARVGCSKGV